MRAAPAMVPRGAATAASMVAPAMRQIIWVIAGSVISSPAYRKLAIAAARMEALSPTLTGRRLSSKPRGPFL